MSCLVTVTGRDRPGITSSLTGILAKSGGTLLDIGQAVIRGHLSLSLLFEASDTKAVLKELLLASMELGMRLDYQDPLSDEAVKHHNAATYRYVVTLMSTPIEALALHDVAGVLSKHACNIDTITRLSDGNLNCVELSIHSTRLMDRRSEAERALKRELLLIAQARGVDIAFQQENLFRRAKRLVVFDMDSTLIQNEVIDEFARVRGKFDEVSAITKRAMEGGLSFDESLKLRCEVLKGLTAAEIDRVDESIQLTPGAKELVRTLKTLGYKVALISGGFIDLASRLKTRLGIDFVYANQMEMKDGVFTGRVIPPIVNAERKADLLDLIAQAEHIHPEQVIAVGDGANDLKMLERAGLGIAFNAKPVVRERADLALDKKDLRSILFLLGIREADVR